MRTEFHCSDFRRDWRARFVARWPRWQFEACFDGGDFLFGPSLNGVPTRNTLGLFLGPVSLWLIRRRPSP